MPQRPQILILDDDAELRALFAEGLEDRGYACRVMADPAELSPRDWQWADVAVVDLNLGSTTDGAIVLRRMGAAGGLPKLILVSGFDNMVLNTAARAARDLGYDVIDALPKPVAVDTIEARITAIDQRPQLSSVRPGRPISVDELQGALDRSEFTIALQPKVRLKNDTGAGAEVLARWHSPVLGTVSPDHFVAAAEGFGLIGRLTDAVVEQALGVLAASAAQGSRPTLSINLSAALLGDPDLVDRFVARAAALGILPAQIIWELTETAVVTLRGTALETAARLRLAGFGLSLDDFGAGENRFERLIGLPFTELKLDRRFTEGMRTPHGRRVVRGIVAMAHAIGVTCVAEGVEWRDQADHLRDAGCDLGQGWLFGRPVPASDFLPSPNGAGLATIC
jgi:EAL domain-containing protein (putative c-di-GMP-specific phosphodiesterase class I)/ActR/RegA family two-component response regulator